MPEKENLDKAARLISMMHLLYRNRRGLTLEQIAEHTGVTVRQVYRDIDTLESIGMPIYEPEPGRWAFEAGNFVPPVLFTQPEAFALFIAIRLLARFSDDQNPVAVDALAKLASALPAGVAEHIQASAVTLSSRPRNPDFVHVFSTVTRGWAEQRWVHIRYHKADSGETDETDLAPYFIEPSAVGFATYVIGLSRKRGELRTIKLERIQSAYLLDETYQIPADFDPAALLATAWGIVFALPGEKLDDVVLRFSPEAARRVRESRWHPLEERIELSNGGCELHFRVAQAWELKPWIRQWGKGCVVVKPDDLRREIAEEMEEAANNYRGE